MSSYFFNSWWTKQVCFARRTSIALTQAAKISFSLLFLALLSTGAYAQALPDNYCNGTTADWANFTSTYPTHAYAKDKANAHDDDQFTQGSKDIDPIEKWRWANGNSNDKGDITNAGTALTNDGCVLRFFGDRTAVNGDAQIGFWFFVNPVEKTGSSSGSFSGSHTNGDLLILSNFTNGGGHPELEAYFWQDGSLVEAYLDNIMMCAGVNSSPQAVPAGLTYTPKGGGSQYPTGAFFEGAINLCALRELNPQISMCFSYFVMETRNSQSITASLQDFAGDHFNLMPTASPASATLCETTAGGGTAVFDLTTLEATVINGQTGVDIDWFSDADLETPITDPANYESGTDEVYALVTNALVEVCNAQATVSLTVNPQATVDAGENDIVCADAPAVTLAGEIGGAAASASWVGGNGTFTPGRNALNATYTPSPAEITAGSVVLTLTTNDPDGPCPAASDAITITIKPVATVTPGGPDRVCQSSDPDPITLMGASVGGSATMGSWEILAGGGSLSSTEPTANPAAITYTPAPDFTGTVRLRLTTNDPDGPCPAVNAERTIVVDPAATVDAGDDVTVCAAAPAVTLDGSFGGGASSASWVGGTGTFAPNRNTLTAVYTPSAAEIDAGEVTLTLMTNNPEGPCEAVSEQVVITINEDATAEAGGPDAVCQSDSPSPIMLAGASVGGGATTGAWEIISGGGTLSSMEQTANPEAVTYTPAAGYYGSVVLRLTSNDPEGPCDEDSDDRIITIHQTPVLVITNPAPVCAPATVDLTAAAITAGSTLPAGTELSYWMDAGATVAVDDETAVGNGIYYIMATTNTDPACSDIAAVEVTVEACLQEGCTLGYWKNHTDRWCEEYSTGMRYGSVFEDAPAELANLTLLQALNLGGGDIYNLARQSVAAILNACHDDVTYTIEDVQEIIDAVNAAFTSGTAGDYALYLDELNNAGCPLGGTPATTSARTSSDKEAVPGLDSQLSISAYPNPARDMTTLRFSSPVATEGVLQVFSLDGKQVGELFRGKMEAGKVYEAELSISPGASSMLFYILQTEGGRSSGKILTVK